MFDEPQASEARGSNRQRAAQVTTKEIPVSIPKDMSEISSFNMEKSDEPVDSQIRKLKEDLAIQSEQAKIAKLKAEQALIEQNIKAKKRAARMKQQ